MKSDTFITLAREEIQKHIPYMAVWELRDSAVWNTGKRKKRWKEEFTEKEIVASTRVFNTARDWAVKNGVPDEVTISVRTYALWRKLGSFYANL